MRLGVFLTGTGALVAGAPPGRLACAQPAPNRSANSAAPHLYAAEQFELGVDLGYVRR
jgi:hypothetical protein